MAHFLRFFGALRRSLVAALLHPAIAQLSSSPKIAHEA